MDQQDPHEIQQSEMQDPDLEADQLENSSAEKALRVFWWQQIEHEPATPLWQRKPTASWAASDRSSPAGQGRQSFPCSQHWADHTCSAASSSALPSRGVAQEKHGRTGASAGKGHRDDDASETR